MDKLLVNRKDLIENNIGLVHACANKFRGRGLEYEDMFQTGCVGLVKAADAFDSSRGFAFSTYAVPVILGEIKRLFRDGGTIKISRELKKKARDVQIQKERLTDLFGRSPTISELANSLKLEITETVELLTISQPIMSLTVDKESGSGQLDIPVSSPEDHLFDRLSLSQVIEKLEEKKQKLIYYRYYKCLTQLETAQKLNMTQVQVSRLEKKILLLLREKLE